MSLQASQTPRPTSQLEPKNQSESESQDEPLSLFIVHEAKNFGGPFGVFARYCVNTLLDELPKVQVLMAIPHKGNLLFKLKKEMKDHVVKKGLPWFDLNIDEFLTYLAEVLQDDFDEQKSVHYTAMDIE
jgi:hypothetical protein